MNALPSCLIPRRATGLTALLASGTNATSRLAAARRHLQALIDHGAFAGCTQFNKEQVHALNFVIAAIVDEMEEAEEERVFQATVKRKWWRMGL